MLGLAGAHLIGILLGNVVFQNVDPALQTSLGFITFPVTVGVVVVGSIWFYRAGENADRLGAAGRSWSSVWGILGWLIPVANLVIPYLYTREVWKASDPRAGPTEWRQGAVPPWLDLWWGLWGGAGVLALVGAVGGLVVGLRRGAEAAAAGTPPGPIALPEWLVAIGWLQLGLMMLAYPLFAKLLYALQDRQWDRSHRQLVLQQKGTTAPPTGTF